MFVSHVPEVLRVLLIRDKQTEQKRKVTQDENKGDPTPG